MDLSGALRSEKVADAGYRKPVTVGVDATLRDAIATMGKERVGCVLVVEGKALAGIFTERDLIVRVCNQGVPPDTPIRDVMTTEPVIVGAEDPLHVALSRMRIEGVRHAPVLDEQGALVGATSIKRTVHFLAEHLREAIVNLPPEPGVYPATPEGG